MIDKDNNVIFMQKNSAYVEFLTVQYLQTRGIIFSKCCPLPEKNLDHRLDYASTPGPLQIIRSMTYLAQILQSSQ